MWLFSADRRAQRFGRTRRTGQDARGGPGAAGAMARPGGGDGDGRCRSERWSDGRGEGIRCQAREPSQPERSGSVRRISTAHPNPHIEGIFSWSQPNPLSTSIQTARKRVQPSRVGSSTSTKHTVIVSHSICCTLLFVPFARRELSNLHVASPSSYCARTRRTP